jgi:hypothetical protein
MLVYCNNLLLKPPDGIDAVTRCIATWVGRKSKGYVNPKALYGGTPLSLKDGSRLSCESTLAPGSSPSFPLLLLATLTFDMLLNSQAGLRSQSGIAADVSTPSK